MLIPVDITTIGTTCMWPHQSAYTNWVTIVDILILLTKLFNCPFCIYIWYTVCLGVWPATMNILDLNRPATFEICHLVSQVNHFCLTKYRNLETHKDTYNTYKEYNERYKVLVEKTLKWKRSKTFTVINKDSTNGI